MGASMSMRVKHKTVKQKLINSSTAANTIMWVVWIKKLLAPVL
jgi:hypothetical protein